MIDPKLNELPVAAPVKEIDESKLTPKQRAELARRRRGLSINETVASGPNRSVGSRGVDTSGAEAGSGAGAGPVHTGAGTEGESPAPEMTPGATGTGTTPRGGSAKK
jgi:hypothetical protein